ncbi:MAG: hypothetical protein DYG98_16225 [Haliscomenobacteraceae bacterium CHB4]|nr:hypothetical protein [Haliscomenobacteraceae bacterium CHB4]
MKDVMLITHFLGLGMGLGTSFANMFFGIAGAQMEPNEASKLRLASLVLSKMGQLGLLLLVVSGIFLMTPYWQILPSSPLLIAKLLLVAALITLVVLIHRAGARAKTGDAETQFKKIQRMGKMALLTSLMIVLLAVLYFH